MAGVARRCFILAFINFRCQTPVCLENLDSDVMVMKSAENGARGHSAKMLDRAS
jgi:hypothetical protein